MAFVCVADARLSRQPAQKTNLLLCSIYMHFIVIDCVLVGSP